MAPVKLGYADSDGFVNHKHLDFYRQRSPFLGAVIPEPLYLDKGLRELPSQLGIAFDDQLSGLRELTEMLHASNTQAIAHLNHPGRMANPKIPGNYFWSSSPVACENGGAKPEAMSVDMMQQVIRLFIEAALRAVKANFDMLEIQFGHGYLLAQFLSPAVNARTDEYGGSEENRFRFPLEVAKALRQAVSIPLIARLSGDEMMEKGFHPEEMIRLAKELKALGFNALHITAGSACTTPPWFFQHMFTPKGHTWSLAEMFQKSIDLPVIFVGRINSSADIDLLKSKGAQYLAVGRSLVADPDFIGKYQGKISGNIRPCLACAEGCLGGVKQGKGLGCVVNPLVNTSLSAPLANSKKQRVAVVGGGLAGMQSALTLAERGFQVDLFEKNKLGGQFNLAWLPPKKESLKELVTYFIQELSRLKVNIIYADASVTDIENEKYAGVIMATGAHPAVPPIEGLKEFYWTEFLEDDQLPDHKKVLVIGGGMIGMEVASKLVDGNNQVVIVELLDEMAAGMEMLERNMTLAKLKTFNTSFYTGYRVAKINNGSAIIASDKDEVVIDHIDKIVVATGMRSYRPFAPSETMVVSYVGDALEPGNAQKAIHTAYELAGKFLTTGNTYL